MKNWLVTIAVMLLGLASVGIERPADAKMRPMNGKAAVVVHSWATCTGKFQPELSRNLLAMDYRTEAYRTALSVLARKSRACLFPGGSLRLGGSLPFAGGLAESLYERTYGRETVSAFNARLASAAPLAARDEMEMIGLCVARREPQAVRVLLGTSVATDAEQVATTALKPTVESCVRAGARARIDRWSFRSLVALGLYRLAAHAPRAAQLSLKKRRDDA